MLERQEYNMEQIDIILNNPDREAAYFDLVKLYLQSNEEARQEIRDDWAYGEKWRYPKSYRLACSVGEKYSPKEKLIASLVYHVIENTEITHREQLIDLAIVYQSCLLADLDPSNIFKKIAEIATPNVAKRLKDFVARDEESKSLKAFYLAVHIDEHGDKELHMKW